RNDSGPAVVPPGPARSGGVFSPKVWSATRGGTPLRYKLHADPHRAPTTPGPPGAAPPGVADPYFRPAPHSPTKNAGNRGVNPRGVAPRPSARLVLPQDNKIPYL